MKTLVEPMEGNKVKLSVEVDEQEFEQSIDAAYKKIAREVRFPGFRPGKAPRRIIEARLGSGVGRSEALRDSLGEYYAKAVNDQEVDVIAPPEIDITSGEDSGPVAFDAVVEVRPQVSIDGYKTMEVTIPSPDLEEGEVDAQIDRLRGNFASLAEVDRAVEDGDNVTIDMAGSKDGETMGALSADDFVYGVGSAAVLPELDEKLVGANKGDTLEFDAQLGEDTVQLSVKVTGVQAKVLPELTDEWAAEASEFTSVDELRKDMTQRLGQIKQVQANMALRQGTLDKLVEMVGIEAPEPLVNSEVERRIHDLSHRLEAQGATVPQWLQATGQSEEQVVAEMRDGASSAVKADLALRSIAAAEEIEASDEDFANHIANVAGQYQVTPVELIQALAEQGQLANIRVELRKGKALEWLVENVTPVDEEGVAVDRSRLQVADLEAGTASSDPVLSEGDDSGSGDSDQLEAEATDTGETQSTPESGEA